MMKNLKWCVVLGAVLIGGCGGGGGGPSAPATLTPNSEPTGASWKPVVLASASAVSVAAPGATAAQLSELHGLEAKRTPAILQTIQFWNAGSTLRWNEIARALVAKYRVGPPPSARTYVILSVAQYDALIAAWNAKYNYRRTAPAQLDPTLTPLITAPADPSYPSEHAVVAGASAAILSSLYPAETSFLADKAREDEESRLYAGVNLRGDIEAGDKLGRDVAARVLAFAASDGANAQLAATVATRSATSWWIDKTHADAADFVTKRAETDPGRWTGTNPLLPHWGEVRGWLISSPVPLRPPPPPAFGSAEFNAALAEVRHISDTRTPEQLRIAQFWADGAGTATPPGHWNQIAADLIAPRHWSELRTARAFALLDMAEMDAGICCWDAKYLYYFIRPFQADLAITTPIGQPNFPSYTSGHSTFSGAAATILGYLMPDKQADLTAMAQEASVSRIYGGIHYRFDCDQGLVTGKAVGNLAVQRARSDGAPD